MKYSLKLGMVLVAAIMLFTLPALAQQKYYPDGSSWSINQGTHATAVTTSDVTLIPATRALYIGAAGSCTAVVQLVKDSVTVTFQNLQPGQILPIQVIAVKATNTTCANIIALY